MPRCPRPSLTAILSLTCAFALTIPSVAQISDVTNSTSTPIEGAGHDYIKLLNESVNPANGSVSLRIQVPTPQGRGLSLPFAFAYDSNSAKHVASWNDGGGGVGWADNTAYLGRGGWSYSVPTLTVLQVTESLGGGHHGLCVYDADFVFQDETGGRHSLYLSIDESPLSSCQWATPILPVQKLTAGDWVYQAALTAINAPVRVADADGSVYAFGLWGFGGHPGGTDNEYSSLVSSIEDRNGNVITVHDLNSQHPGAFSATDTLGRTLLSSSGFGTSGDTISVSGLPNPYTVVWETNTGGGVQNIGQKAIYISPNGCSGIPTPMPGGGPAIKQINLPNGRSYSFEYDANYGLLSKIKYPSGGSISYTYTLNPLSEFQSFPDQTGLPNGCTFEYDTPAVQTRTVSFDGVRPALTQVFTYNNPATTWDGTGTKWTTKTTTVTTTDNLSGLAYTTVYSYTPFTAAHQPNDYSSFQPQLPLEHTVITTAAGNTLRTVTKGWLNPYELQSVQTSLGAATARTSLTTYAYGSGAQVTERDDYDYGTGAAGPLLRKTTTTYQTFVASPIYPAGASIFDRPCKQIVYDGSNNPLAENDYFYDGGTALCATAPLNLLPGTGNYTGHDETNYGTTVAVSRGNVTQMVQLVTGGTSPMTTYTYDETGQRLSETDPCGNVGCSDMTSGQHTTTFLYADSYTVLSGGQNVTYTPATSTNAFLTTVTDPLRHISKFSYDFNNGQLTASQDQNDVTASRPGTTYIYNDSFSRPTQVNYPDLGQTEYTYTDAAPPSVTACQNISGTAGAVCSATSPAPGWKTSLATMDGLGHVAQTKLLSDPSGADLVDISYDGGEHVLTRSNPHRTASSPTDGTTNYIHDAFGRTTQVTDPDGSTVVTTYDQTNPKSTGTCSTVTDEVGSSHQSCFDGLGRLAAVWEDPGSSPHLNYETDYAYDALGNLTCAVQKGSDTTAFTTCAAASSTWRPRSFVYDSLSRLTSAINPETGTLTYSYDANSNVSSLVSPKPGQFGTATTAHNYTYDVENRRIQESHLNPSDGTEKYAYDGITLTGCPGPAPGAVSGATNLVHRTSAICSGVSASAYSYDPMGRVAVEKRSNKGSSTKAYNIGYNYWLDGSLDTLTYPSGNIVTYQMGGAGLVTKVSDSANNVYANSVTYAPHGALAGMTSGANGTAIVTQNIYNDRLQPTLLSATQNGQPTAFFSLCYDFHSRVAINNAPCSFGAYTSGNNGNVFQVIDNYDSTRSATFAYDRLNRIMQANTINTTSSNCWGEIYSIDTWSNLTNIGGVSSMGSCWHETLTANPASNLNQLSGYCHDAAGNLVQSSSCPVVTPMYTYDAENRLSSTAGYTYYYDAHRVRIEKTNGTLGTMYWPGPNGEYLTETDLTGSSINEEYIYFNGGRVARVDRPSGTVHYYFSDKLNSANAITDPSGNVQQRYYYYPYGGMVTSPGSDGNRYKFTGKERDSESGLDVFGARYYGSSLGRFMTPDWMAKATAVPYADFGDPQTLNLYGYVRNNPLFRADADGHSDAGTFCNTQCRYGTPVSSAEIQVEVGVLELGSAVATGGATLEAMGAGAALKTALGAVATAGLGVSGTTRIIATATGEESENLEEGTTAVTTLTTPAGMAVTLGTGGNLKAGAVATDLTSAATAVKNPVEAAKDPAGTALTVANVVQDIKAGYNALKSLVSSPPAPAPPPPPPPPKCSVNDACQ